jgi:hypothetical protein
MDPLEFLDDAKKSIFRFERLQDYTAEDGVEIVERYIKTGDIGGRPVDMGWCLRIKALNEKKILTQRVRLVEFPLNDYTKWELAWHRAASEFSGDDIRVISDKKFEEIIQEGVPDYWMIDDALVFTLNYGPHGKYLGADKVPEGGVVRYVDYKQRLLEHSTKIRELLK